MMEGNELNIFNYFPAGIFLDVSSILSSLTFPVGPSIFKLSVG